MRKKPFLLILIISLTQYLNGQPIQYSYDINGNRIKQVNNTVPTKPIITKSGQNTLLSSVTLGNQWYFLNNSSKINGATNQNYNPNQSGYYLVKVTNNYGCSNISDPFNYILTAIVNLTGGQYIKVNPTLTSQSIYIDFLLINTNTLQAQLFNVSGQSVFGSINISNGFTMDLSKLANGIYILKITNGKTIIRFFKIIKV